MYNQNRIKRCVTAAAAVTCLGAVCSAEEFDTSFMDMAMFGIDRNSGHLMRYEFTTGAQTSIGVVRDSSGNTITGIEASAYIPGFRNLYAFWQDPADGQVKLLYVNTGSGEAAAVGKKLGHGGIHGAVAVEKEGTGGFPDSGWIVYAVQSEGEEPVPITGTLNINPNHTVECSFELTIADDAHPDGADADADPDMITIHDLHKTSPVDVSGTYYTGLATLAHVQPKGSGKQNSLFIDGLSYPVYNSNTYDIRSSTMQVRIYNDHISDGKAMGQWYIEFIATNATIEISCGIAGSDGTPGANPENRLIAIDHKTGIKAPIMLLAHAYDSLATIDGSVFYGYSGNNLYKIDTVSGSESLVGSTAEGQTFIGMEFAGKMVMGFDEHDDHLVPVNKSSANSMGYPATIGSAEDQSTIVFMPLDLDPEDDSISYD